MSAYTIKKEICCCDCKDVFEADYNKKATELDAEGVAEYLLINELQQAKCCYCDVVIEHDSEALSQLIASSSDRAESDMADKTAWHNGRFGR